MPLWIAASLFAALAQAMRFAMQKSLAVGGLSPTGATFARFAYSAPLVATGVAVYLMISGTPPPSLSGAFWMFAIMGGAAQIPATVFVVMLFQTRHFAVGVTFAKIEVILTVLMGFILLGDMVTWDALSAIVLGVVGVVLLSVAPGEALSLRGIWSRSAALGLAAGLLFSISAVSYRGASLEIDAVPLLRSSMTLAVVTTMQMTALVAWLVWRDRGEIARVARAWPRASLMGLASLAGSSGWFLAFTLQNAAYVKAVGQVETIFVLLLGAMVFGERVTTRELWGMVLLTGSILGLLVAV
ncbi:MAG: EamA family transporter [Marinovum sp.]|nr:EamA family transporter [Marinovum sp.]